MSRTISVFVVTGVLNLSSCPTLASCPSTPSPLSHSVGMPSPFLANYNTQQRLANFFQKGQDRMQCCQGSCPHFCLWYFTVRVNTSPNATPHHESASAEKGGKVLVEVGGFQCSGGLAASLCPRFTTHSTGAILGLLFCFQTRGLTAYLLAATFCWFLTAGCFSTIYLLVFRNFS